MAFQKAVKSQSKLRAALFGPSGAGKTYTALAMGSGMGKRIAVIDSERNSAAKYSDRFDFDVSNLQTKNVQEYVNEINAAAVAGYDVLIIDSLTHAWQTLNEDVEKIADARYRGNFWAAWSEGTPMQRKLVDALISYPGHVIATMRSKTEWQPGGEGSGSKKVVRVGLSPEQGKGIEYEFDILFEITVDHLATIIKDRTGKFQDRIIEKPGFEFGQELAAWLDVGAEPPPPTKTTEQKKAEYQATINEIKKVMEATYENGKPIFSEIEWNEVSNQFAALKGATGDQCMATAAAILDEKKNQIHQRLAMEPPKPPAPPVPENNHPADDSFGQESLADAFRRQKTDTAQSAGQTTTTTEVPEMFSEPEEDNFVDDIPDFSSPREKAVAEPQLDIF